MKRTTRNATRVAGVLGALGVVLAACGDGVTPTPATSAPAASQPASSSSAGVPSLSGELTLWHTYGAGGREDGALDTVLESVRAENPDLMLNVDSLPLDQVFAQWTIDVAAGGGPDLLIAPNDNLFTLADAGLVEALDDHLTGEIDGFEQVALDGSKVAGSFYLVPESLEAAALWYDKEAIPTPPATSAELLAGVQDGSIKLGILQGADRQFGWTGAFGGRLMDDTGTCVADEGGFAEAFAYLKSLKDAGATFSKDSDALRSAFESGTITALIDGPAPSAEFRSALSGKLAAVVLPAGPAGPANPITATDGWFINPNSLDKELAVRFALRMVRPDSLQTFVDDSGHVPADPSVLIGDPIVQAFADSAADGLARPQNAQFGSWWGPFSDALNGVIDAGADPAQAVATACAAMNEANGLAP